MSYQEFKNKYNGGFWNYDGQYGYQCWDLVAFYLQDVLNIPVYVISDYQNAINNINSDFFKYFDEVNQNAMEQGDICIWTDSLHICLYDHWDGQLWFLTQDANARPTGVYNQVTSGHYFRAFRKKQPKPLFTIQDIPKKTVKFKIDVSLWNLNFNTYADAVAVDKYPKGGTYEVSAIAKHKVGSSYYISTYDRANGINNGINVDDCEDYIEQIVTEPTTPNENNNIKPVEEDKQEDNTNTTKIEKVPKSGFKLIIYTIIKNILDYLKERYNNDKKNFKGN